MILIFLLVFDGKRKIKVRKCLIVCDFQMIHYNGYVIIIRVISDKHNAI